MFPNDECRLVSILGKARLSREEAVLTPPIEHEVSAFIGKRTVKNFVAAVDSVDHWFASARIF